jgi:hypothetical protein
MYVRTSRAHCDPSECDEVLASAQRTNPALSQLPGFQSSYWGVDRAKGAFIAVSVGGHEILALSHFPCCRSFVRACDERGSGRTDQIHVTPE